MKREKKKHFFTTCWVVHYKWKAFIKLSCETKDFVVEKTLRKEKEENISLWNDVNEWMKMNRYLKFSFFISFVFVNENNNNKNAVKRSRRSAIFLVIIIDSKFPVSFRYVFWCFFSLLICQKKMFAPPFIPSLAHLSVFSFVRP